MHASIAPSTIIRPMLATDLLQVVDVHLKSFQGFFLTFLGQNFLTLLYKSILSDSQGIVLVASSNGKIEGFVAGVTHQVQFYEHLIMKKKWAFAWAALSALLKRPAIASRLIRSLRRPAEARQSSVEACLMSIAVRPESEGKGIGQQLVEAFCQTLAERGVDAVCLTTDRDNNEGEKRFYLELGFRLGRSYVSPEGRTMNEYVMPLGEDSIRKVFSGSSPAYQRNRNQQDDLEQISGKHRPDNSGWCD